MSNFPLNQSPSDSDASLANSNSAQQTLNLLLVFPDEMRAFAQGFKNSDPVFTPNIDKFAASGFVVDQMVCNYPLCSPFRAMFLTGQYPIHNGVTGNTHDYGGKVGIELSPFARCWSDVLSEQGYSLGYIGKWHLDVPEEPYIKCYNNPMEGKYWNDWTPPSKRHGFAYWYSYGTYDKHMRPMYWANNTPREAPFFVDQWGPIHEADMTIEFLRNKDNAYRDPNKPFALVVSMNPPHSPYDQVPQKYLDIYKGKTSRDLNTRPNVIWDKKYPEGYGPENFLSYMAMVCGVDEQFGRILAELEAQGLADNTLVVFFSDHGCCLGSNGHPTKNTHHEESMRVPMIFRLPQQIPQVLDTNLLMSAPDLYPTILGLLGFHKQIPDRVEGVDFSQYILAGGLENYHKLINDKLIHPKQIKQAGLNSTQANSTLANSTQDTSPYSSKESNSDSAEQLFNTLKFLQHQEHLSNLPPLPNSQMYYMIPYGQQAFGKRGVRTKRYTLMIDRQDGEPLKYTLHDNSKDPYQMTNIAADCPELIRQLIKEELIPWLEKTGDSWRPVEFESVSHEKLVKSMGMCDNC